MKKAKKEKILKQLEKKVTKSDEITFLKYLIDCCENILESKKMIEIYTPYIPPMMQLMKMRAEITFRLESKGIKYGKFANRRHLLGKKPYAKE